MIMNKRFSTLMAMGLLATSSLCGSAWAADPVPAQLNKANLKAVDGPADAKEAWGSGPFIVVFDTNNNGVAEDGEFMMQATVDAAGKTLTYSGVELGTVSDLTDDLLWYFNEDPKRNAVGVLEGYLYSLESVETGKALTVKGTALTTNADESVHDASKSQYATFAIAKAGYTGRTVEHFKQKGTLWFYDGGTTTSGNGLYYDSRSNTVKINASASRLLLCTLDRQTVDFDEAAKIMNDVKGGEGFNLKFDAPGKKPWKNDILTDTNLKAFYVKSTKNLGNDMTIPAGVYFATDYPEELNGTDQITSKEQFEACTFVAISPKGNYEINKADRTNGIGFELLTVAGAEMNFYSGTNEDDLSAGEEVYVGNACFNVEVADPMFGADKYNFVAKNIRVLKETSATKNPTELHAADNKYIGVITDQKENYMVTTGQDAAMAFQTDNSTLMDVAELLQKEDAPSIYTIQFVSGKDKEDEATEYNQYLTVESDNSKFRLASTVEFDGTDPMYQFVISAVNKEDKTATFTNRQTGVSVELSLYENKEDVYTVYPVTKNQKVYVEWRDGNDYNSEVVFEDVNLANTKVVLTPYAVEDKFATFENRATGAGLVTFELANNDASGAEFYVGGKKNKDGKLLEGDLLAYTEDMTQFELVKSKKAVSVLNNYVYLKDTRVLTSRERDTVAYYTYAVKAFDADVDNLYLNTSANLEEQTDAEDADQFIIKHNIDKSVSLIAAGKDVLNKATTDFFAVNETKNMKDKSVAWKNVDNYDLDDKLSVGLKTFMVEENPAISYEAVPQHVSFEAVRGGFMTMDENNDARLAIAGEAGEDLTFWIDTVHSDRNIPLFYIAKGGNFLYNATDSANHYSPRGNKRFDVEIEGKVYGKLIFKAGELTASDTLSTVVDGKSVLVAEKDNAPKKIKGGLENFQFQIIRAEDGSDDYLIRQGARYICQYNNYFYMGANKDAAYSFNIEKQSTPTANEGVEVSEVKVIAGEGQVTIAGAAGKKVVISNILGQVVANTVASSDNAVIAAPAGVVVVAVEGEAAVKAIVK